MLSIDLRTIRLPKAAYTDLLSTGNLRVIRDREIRDAIVRFYEMAERSQTIIDKNNMTYVDGLAWDSFYRDGLVYGHRYGDMGLAFLEAASETVRSRLGADFQTSTGPALEPGPGVEGLATAADASAYCRAFAGGRRTHGDRVDSRGAGSRRHHPGCPVESIVMLARAPLRGLGAFPSNASGREDPELPAICNVRNDLHLATSYRLRVSM